MNSYESVSSKQNIGDTITHISSNEHLKQWTSQPMNISTNEHLNQWTSQPMNISTNEHLNQWTSQPMNISTNEHLWSCELKTRSLFGIVIFFTLRKVYSEVNLGYLSFDFV